ncbi:MAG: hybrid sensor histidine kinase/response regulator [Methylococcales bacterium]
MSENCDLTGSYVKTALMDLYLDHQTYSGIASALGMTFLSIVLWNNFSNQIILIWLACGYVISLIRSTIHIWIKARIKASKQYRYNQFTALTIVFISSTVWGSAAWLFLDTAQTEIFIFIIVIISGICAGAVTTHASFMPAMWIFLINALGLLALKLFSMDYHSLALLALLFIVVLIGFSRSLRSIIVKSITIDFRNQILLKEATTAKELAENASQAKSQFLTTASHDLRQPLHAIAALINLFKTKSKDTELTRIAESMEISTDTMMTLFDSILDVSRLDAGITSAHTVPTDLHAILNTLILQFKAQAEKKNLSFSLEYTNTTTDTPCIVMADKIHLERCLNNIVNNAIKFTQTGGITIELVDTINTMQISINDSGEGIAEKEFEHIFEEFSQVRTLVRAQGQGLGLGLSIVKRLTQLMDIELNLTSTIGEGSCFTLSINKAPKRASVPVMQPIAAQNEILFSGLNILIVDDDDTICKSLQQLIECWQCQAFTANDLAQAIITVKQAERIDVILIDYGLRNGVTGLDVIEHLFTTLLPNKPPVLIITGDTSAQSMTALNASGFAFLHKPVKPIKIRNFLQRIDLKKYRDK